METSLHQQLKRQYAASPDQVEVRIGNFRIDALDDGWLVEIQHGSLAAIRDKTAKLLDDDHQVRIVKPIVRSKRLVKRARKGGKVVDQRMSPKRGTLLDMFDELLYFRNVFPHARLRLETPLVDIEEWRYPGHGRRRRRRDRDHVVEDQKLVEVCESHTFTSAADVLRLIPAIDEPFDTQALAEALDIQRWVAQKIAYTCRHIGAMKEVGKRGNAKLYRRAA